MARARSLIAWQDAVMADAGFDLFRSENHVAVMMKDGHLTEAFGW